MELWGFYSSVFGLSQLQLAGIAGSRLSDDRAGAALGGAGKLFGEQEV